MAEHKTTPAATPPLTDARLDALLSEATRMFGAPVALLSPRSAHTVRAVFASVPVTTSDGQQRASLCLLGAPQPRILPFTSARLHELAARAAAAMEGTA